MSEHPYFVMHRPTNDEAEADTMAAARVAAETLIKDNDWTGSCVIMREHNTMGILHAGIEGSFSIGGYWITPEEER